jgi:hypothetical protein
LLLEIFQEGDFTFLNKKLLIIIIALAIATPIAVYAWNDCPYGLIDDPVPGQCPRYVDSNGDAICDHSESPTTGTVNNNTINQSNNQSNQVRGGDDEEKVTTQNTASAVKNSLVEQYYLIPITLSLVFFYLATYYLSRKNRSRSKLYKRLWNIILSVSFILTGITGLFLIISLDYRIQSSLNMTIDFWHAEFGIIMAVTFLFHVHIYWKAFKKIFKGVF